MCNIIVLQPGQMPVESDLYNMCYNNWHSYGLVTVIDNKLSIKKKLPANGEIDPKEVYDLLVADRQYTRYLHVRHNTAGATSLENTHPFDVYFSENPHRNVVFMHNGTLYDYKPTVTTATNWKSGTTYYTSTDNETGDSDTKKFTEEVLQQLAPLCKGDFSSPTMVMVLKKFWPTTGNRGLIIANDLEPVYLGDWKERADTNGGKYKTSNLDYFDSVTRGPQKSRIEAQKRKEEEEKRKASLTNGFNDNGSAPFRTDSGNILQLPANWPLQFPEYHSVFHLKSDAKGLINELDFWERANSVSVGALTHTELENIYSDRDSCLALMVHIFNDYSSLYDDFCEIKGKHESASKLVAELKSQISILESNRIIN